MEKHCALLVNKCLVGEVPSYFKEYFMLRSQSDNQHRCTRSSITDIILLKLHLDVAKRSFYYHGAMTFKSLPKALRLNHLRNVSRLSPLFILRLFLEHSEIEHCYFLYQLVLIDMCIYIFYFTLFYFILYRAPVDTSLLTEGVTLFKYQLLLLLLLLLLSSSLYNYFCTFQCDIYSRLSCTNSVISHTSVANVSFF